MKKSLEIFVVSMIMTGLSFLSTFPLVKHFGKAIPWAAFREDIKWTLLNHPGDHLQVFYFFWLVKQNILGRVPLNANPYEFNMLDGATAGNDGLTTAPLAFISFLFSPLGDIAAYNCTIITSYVLAGVFMYLLAKMISPSKTSALLAAVIFTFVPIRINGLGGGNQYAFVFFMYPMIFYFMEKCIREEKVRYSILAGLGIVGLSFNEPHLIYYLYLLLAGYLPVRLISLIPVNGEEFPDIPLWGSAKVRSWPAWLSLLVICGGGAAVVCYVHSGLPLYPNEPFFSKRLWIMVIYYPAIFLYLSIMLAALFSHLSRKLVLRQALAIEAGSMVPLYLFWPMALIFHGRGTETTTALIYAVLSTLLVKVYLLRPYLSDMAIYLANHLKAMRRRIVVFSPVVLILVGNAVFTVIAKKTSMAPSTESAGRTLDDVNKFSARLPDIFEQTGNVSLGSLPMVLGLAFLLYLLYRALCAGNWWRKPQLKLPLMALMGLVLLVSYGLAMGLALGDRSLYVLFFEYVPFFNVPRVSDRIVTVTIFVLACIAAGIGGAVVHAFRTRIWMVCCSVAILLLTAVQLKSYSVGVPMALTDLQPIEDGYQYISDNIGDGILLELPLWPGDSHQSSVYQYYSTLDQVKRVNGYTPLVAREYIRTIFNPLHSLDRGFLDREQYDLLRRLKVKYITVHEHSDIFTAKVSPHPPLTTVRRLRMSPYLEYEGPWPIVNKKYDKIHEQIFLFRVRDDVSSGIANDFYTLPTIYGPGGYLRQQTGTVDLDTTSGREVYHGLPGRDLPGFLTFGPYRSFFTGKYHCYFRIKCPAGDEVAGFIDVVRLLGDEPDKLASAELEGGMCDGTYHNQSLNFEIQHREQLGFRVFFTGNSEIFLEKVVVEKEQSNEISSFLEAEKMPGETGTLISADTASGKMAVEARPGKGRKGRMVYGPGIKLDQGNYSAFFHLRLPQHVGKGNPQAVVISAGNTQGDTVYAKRVARTSEIMGNGFSAVRLDFQVPEAEEVDFVVFFTNKATVQLDGIEIMQKTRQAAPAAILLIPDNRDSKVPKTIK